MGRIINRVNRLRRLLTLVLLMTTTSCFILRAQEATSPVEPKAGFDPTSLEVTVGQLAVTKHVLSVTDPTTKRPIRGRFVERWGIIDASNKKVTSSKIVDNRVKFIDPTTGSTVSLLYGLDSIGNKPGKFTVIDSLIPQKRYEDQYTMVIARYTVTVNSPTITAEYYNGSTLLGEASDLQLYSYKNQWGG